MGARNVICSLVISCNIYEGNTDVPPKTDWFRLRLRGRAESLAPRFEPVVRANQALRDQVGACIWRRLGIDTSELTNK
jgi:hypothetical protein